MQSTSYTSYNDTFSRDEMKMGRKEWKKGSRWYKWCVIGNTRTKYVKLKEYALIRNTEIHFMKQVFRLVEPKDNSHKTILMFGKT